MPAEHGLFVGWDLSSLLYKWTGELPPADGSINMLNRHPPVSELEFAFLSQNTSAHVDQ